MMYLEVGQERMAFIGGEITPEMERTRKGSVKVRILGFNKRCGWVRVFIKRTNIEAKIGIRGILPYARKKEETIQIEALRQKYSK